MTSIVEFLATTPLPPIVKMAVNYTNQVLQLSRRVRALTEGGNFRGAKDLWL